MDLIINSIVLILTNLFEIYVMYRFMSVFFDDFSVGKITITSVYIVRFIFGSILLVEGTIPIINILFSILSLFCITLCYKATIIKKIVITMIIWIFMFLTESGIGFIMGKSNVRVFDKVEYFNSSIAVMIQIILWLITLVISRFRNIKKNVPVSNAFILALLIVFIISICMEVIIFQQQFVDDLIAGVSFICVLILNFIIIYLYDSLSGSFIEKTRAELVQREKTYYHAQSELLQKNYDEVKQFRHDVKNRFLAIEEMLEGEQKDKIKSYIYQIVEKLDCKEMFSQTGNTVIDSIVNYKLSQAVNNGIKIVADIVLPVQVNVEEDDMVIILSNLLDNAIEATTKVNDNRYINIRVEYEKESIFISIKNTYDSIIKVINGKIETSKSDSILHGIGLRSVRTTLEKYDGILDLEYDDCEFTANVILYL